MCEKCQAKFGNMEDETKDQLLTGVALGGVATVAGTKVIGKLSGPSKEDTGETISGGAAALAGFFIQDRAKKRLWKGFGLGMMGAGTFVAGQGLIGGVVDKAVDSIFGGFGKSTTDDAPNSNAPTLSAEQLLLNALNAQNNANLTIGTGTGGTNFLF